MIKDSLKTSLPKWEKNIHLGTAIVVYQVLTDPMNGAQLFNELLQANTNIVDESGSSVDIF